MIGTQKNRSPKNRLGPEEVAQLKRKINDTTYLYEAIDALALVLSREILDLPHHGGTYCEREGW